MYNAGHVALRWWALQAGWTHGARVASALHHPLLQRGVAVLGPAMACAVGAALPLSAQYLAAPFEIWARGVLAAAAALAFIALRWLPHRLTGLRLGLGLSAIALVVGWLWP